MMNQKKKYQRFSVSLPESLLKEFDKIRKVRGMSRSDTIRKVIRDYIEEKRTELFKEGSLKAGTITFILNHEERPGIMDELTDIQHYFYDIIDANLHVHLDKQNCMIVLAVRGSTQLIDDLNEELEKRPEIKSIKRIFMPLLSEEKKEVFKNKIIAKS
ncbi:MAG: CopG family ribbon-helix-helix protein [Candidatus Helarchaeota archaeon]